MVRKPEINYLTMKKWKQTKIETKVHLYEFKTQNQNVISSKP